MQNDSKPKQGLNHECNTNERVAKKKELINVRLKTLHISGPFLTKNNVKSLNFPGWSFAIRWISSTFNYPCALSIYHGLSFYGANILFGLPRI